MHAERDEAPPCRRICLCLLCGLPAAGKTTLVQALSNHTALRGWKTLSLIYDELIPQEAFSKVYMESDSQPLQTVILSSIFQSKIRICRTLRMVLLFVC